MYIYSGWVSIAVVGKVWLRIVITDHLYGYTCVRLLYK